MNKLFLPIAALVFVLTLQSCAQSFDDIKVKFATAYYDEKYHEAVSLGESLKGTYPDKLTRNDHYLLAQSYAMVNDTKGVIKSLNKLSENYSLDVDHVIEDTVFTKIRSKPEIKACLNDIHKSNEKRYAKLKYPEIAEEFKVMYVKDQEIRKIMYESGSTQISDSLATALRDNDAINRKRLKEIVDQIGWPGKSLVGDEGANTAFLIAQHSDRDLPLQEFFYSKLKVAFEANEVRASNFAYLTDRILRAKNEPQLYGTQSWENPSTQKFEIAPIADEVNVDRRRFLADLPPLRWYKTLMGIEN